MPKRKQPAPPKAPDTRPVNQRGQEWQAEKLTGARAQKGNLLGGGPNLSFMARQYLGCPATSATVERLFSSVGIAFSDKRKRSQADTLSDILFTKMNVG